MAMINYKLNFCRITLASKLFVRNNYFPLFKVLTPQDATKQIIKNNFVPKNHYIPVLLSHKKRERLSRGKKIRELKHYGKRLHSKIDEFKYMSVVFNFEDDKHKRILDLLSTKKSVQGHYVYQIEERNTCLVFDGRMEEAVRTGDIIDVTISDNADKMIMRLKTGEKIVTEAQLSILDELILLWGEAATTKENESRNHHYGKMIMSIAHIFEMKERCAALYELEKLKFEAKKKQRVEREWKTGMEPLLENLVRETEQNKENNEPSNDELKNLEEKEYNMNIADMNRTLNISERLLLKDNEEIIEKLPLMKEIGKMVKRLGEGTFVELIDTPGVLLTVGDNERFIIGQMVQTDKEKVFVPGQTFETTNGVKYLPGITVNLDNAPTFIAGVIMADDNNSAVFLPGQSFITSDGKMRLTKEGERVTPVGMKKMQMTEDEQWERLEKRKLTRQKQEKEKSKLDVKERRKVKKTKKVPKSSEKVNEIKATIINENVKNEEMQEETKKEEILVGDLNATISDEPEIKIIEPVEEPKISVINILDKIKELSEEDLLTEILLHNDSYFFNENQIDNDKEMIKAKTLKIEQDEERKKNAEITENMKEVINVLEMKKNNLIKKLKSVQNESSIQEEDRIVSYIYPAKANALAIELGFDGQIARNIAKILLAITRLANTLSVKKSDPIPLEIDKEFNNCSDNLKTVLKSAIAETLKVLKIRPQDLEGAMRAAGQLIRKEIEQNCVILQEISVAIENKRNLLVFNDKSNNVNKVETLRSIIREEFNEEKLITRIKLIIENEGEILIRAFINLTKNNTELLEQVYKNIINNEIELISEEKSSEMVHRAIVDAVYKISNQNLQIILKTSDESTVKNLRFVGLKLSEIIGTKTEDILRRVLIMRELSERNPNLLQAFNKLCNEPSSTARRDPNVRELVRESGVLISYASPILSSMDIPNFLFEYNDHLAMEDYVVQHMKKDGALLICKKGIEAVVPKEASRLVLSGLISYTLIDDKGVSTFKPVHLFNGAVKEEELHQNYVNEFDFDAWDSLDYNCRNYLNTFYNNQCRNDVYCDDLQLTTIGMDKRTMGPTTAVLDGPRA